MGLEPLFAEIMGRTTGACRGMGGSSYVTDFSLGMLGSPAIIGAAVPLGAGAAMSAKLLGQDRISVTFFGDGACNIGAFHEALNMAQNWKLPIVFVCENNSFSVYTHLSKRQPRGRKIYKLVESFGIKSFFANQSETIKMINTIIVRIAFLQINDVVSSILLYNDQILILKRSNSVKSFQGRWSGVSGYLEGIEDPLYRAYIEIKEETGLSEICLLYTSQSPRDRG